MKDHELFPAPPVESLDDATRARLRARVVDGLDGAGAPRPRSRWVVPAAAAAAVLVVAGVTAGLALGDDPEAPGGTLDPAASSSPGPSTSPSEAQPEPGPGPGCAPEVQAVLRDAEPVLTTASDTGTTTFYVAGSRWTLCSTHGGRATVHRPGRLGGPDDQQSFGISSVIPRSGTSTFVAGGPLPDGVTSADILYVFPDGHEEPATVQTGDDGRAWWQIEYTVTGGPLNRGNQLRLDPITVGAAYDDGFEGSYSLDWALDTCRQANHGC